jgi:cytochrome oxidase assembly protein ShyY1
VRRLVLRWTLLVVFVVVLGIVFVNLGQWQLDRLAQRRDRNSATVANEAKPVQPFEAVFTHPIGDADQWQQVEARGTFDAEHQFVVRYRSNGDDRGYEVVTPLRTASGVVLVDRGFVATDRSGQIPATAPAPPSGEVRLVGHVRRNEQGRRAAVTPVDGQVRLINSDAIGTALGEPVRNGYIGLITVTPAQSGGLVPIELPEINEGPHFWYAVQWFGFAALAAAGIVVFVRGDMKARREEASPANPASVG